MVQLPAFLNHKTAAVKQGTKSSQYREEPQHTIQASIVDSPNEIILKI